MATDKLFTVAGTSKLDGEMKVRFANDVMRIKVLAKHGHEDITLIELPNAMTKLEAVKFIQSLDEFQGVAEQSAIGDYLDRNTEGPATKQPKSAVKEQKPKKESKKPTKDKTAESEDQPFGFEQALDAVGEATM